MHILMSMLLKKTSLDAQKTNSLLLKSKAEKQLKLKVTYRLLY